MQDRVEATPTADTLHSVFLNSFPFPDIASRHELLARWAAATGDGQTLVAELAAHAETMPEGAWDLFRDPMIGSYSNEPGFSAIAQRFEDMSEAIRSALADEGVL
jgi:hypothetical protein